MKDPGAGACLVCGAKNIHTAYPFLSSFLLEFPWELEPQAPFRIVCFVCFLVTPISGGSVIMCFSGIPSTGPAF